MEATLNEKPKSMRSQLDELEIGSTIPIPLEKRKSWQQTITTEFHVLETKRFEVTSVNQPRGMGLITRTA